MDFILSGGMVESGNIGSFDYATLPPAPPAPVVAEWQTVRAARNRDASAETAIVRKFQRAVECIALAAGAAPDDTAQETWCQFFVNLRAGKFVIPTETDCGNVVRTIARRMAGRFRQRFSALRRGGSGDYRSKFAHIATAVKTLSISHQQFNEDNTFANGNAPIGEPEARPVVDTAYPDLGFGAEYQKLAELIADGHSTTEAADRMKIGVRRAQRMLEKMRAELS